MFFLIDECCAKGLVRIAQTAGHAAQRTIEVAALGRAADDSSIFQFARRTGAVLVTVNAIDFQKLAARTDHHGIVSLPAVREPGQSALFRRTLPVLARHLSQAPNRVVEVDAAGTIRVLLLR
jgi:predicted nuclease of predicted toxin-antitoxin system